MRTSTRWKRSAPHDLDAMVMAPALPNLSHMGVKNADNNPPPSKAKVDTGVSNHSEPDMTRVNLKDSQALGIWNLMKQADDPSHVSHLYRQYRDSKYCSVPKDQLRRMRDVMISDMREQNKSSSRPRRQTQVGRNAPTWNDPQLHIRRGA
jgi:hypothetical protein